MVLNRLLLVTCVVACNHSLFDNNIGGDGGANGDQITAMSCPATCIANAGADYDGTAGGMGGRWQYFEDTRNRAWAPMTPATAENILVGADTNNKIGSCKQEPNNHACQSLPGALRVSSSGATAAADPAIAWTSTSNQVIQLTAVVAVPTGTVDQVVRVYRNSREDVLVTFTVAPGATMQQQITVDALANDRFFLAIAPTAMGVQNIAVHFFVSATGAAFPSKCQIAIPFEAALTGNTVDNVCGGDFAYTNYNTSATVPPVLVNGPFAERGKAADITPDHFFDPLGAVTPVDRSGDSTVQFWMKFDALVTSYAAHPFSDSDLNNTGGLDIALYDNSGLQIEINTCKDAGNPLQFDYDSAAYPTDNAWHFIRVTHTNGMVSLCVDGKKVAGYARAAGGLMSSFKPRIGKDVIWTPAGAFFDGQIDDLRVLTTALACE